MLICVLCWHVARRAVGGPPLACGISWRVWATTASAAMIYQHEARGADQSITRAIDSHVQAEQANDDDDDGQAGVLAPVG